jgi:hypothetical protein
MWPRPTLLSCRLASFLKDYMKSLEETGPERGSTAADMNITEIN